MNTPTAIAVPTAIQTWVDDVAVHGGAVILFGSRADDRAQPGSDWDIAVVGDAGLVADVPYGSFDNIEVQVFHITAGEFKEQQNVYPGIAYEVAHNGVLLAGEHLLVGDIVKKQEGTVIDVKKLSNEFGRFVGGAFDYAWDFITHTEDFQFWDKFTDAWDVYDERAQRLLPERSADCAEFTVKALCLATGGDYAWGHDTSALAETVPTQLRDRVRALNGYTRADHTAGYAGAISSPRKVCQRVVDAMSLLADMARWKAPLLPDRAQYVLHTLKDVERSVATLDEARHDESVVCAFHKALGAWQARVLEIARGLGPAPGLE